MGQAYVVLADGVTALTYVIGGLTTGTEYKFIVSARNSYGFSDYSTELVVLAA